MLPTPEPVPLTVTEDWLALKDTLRRFEDRWREGPRPAIDDYLPAGDPLRFRVLIELVHIDLELRLKAGEAARVEEYLTRYPELAGDRAVTLALIAAEYELRRRRESDLAPDECQQRFPQYQAELEEMGRPTVAAGGTPRSPASPSAEAPPEIAGYEVLSLLGRGGMGVVYKARQHSLDRPVALKLLPASCARDPVWLERFRREGRTASALNHPNICTIYDTGESAGRPFLSMELVEGRTLEALIGRRPAVEELSRLLGQAAGALAAAHAAGVVHRDIKPANLMVRDDGIVKVLDFGLARRLPAAGGQHSTSTAEGSDAGTLVGTLRYMSPEQARAQAVDAASDIFSLGLVLYELATGQHPFHGDSNVGTQHALVARTPVPPSHLNPEVPAALEALIQRMLAGDPRQRPTAPEVAATLTRLAMKTPAAPRSPTAVPGRRPTVGRQCEAAALRAGFEAAAAGHGSVLCVTGEPGLGKTTLVESFLEELAADGQPWSLARGRCSERLAGAEAYLPFLEAVDSLLLGEGGVAAAQALKLLAPTWYVQLVPLAVEDPSLTRVLTEAKTASQERRKRELGVFLEDIGRRCPLVLFLDDVHWADPSSVDLLAYLGSRCSGWRVLVVVTYRPSDLLRSEHPFGPVKLELQGRGVCREVSLPFLTPEDLAQYLALAFAGHRFPDEFAPALHARTEGNPLFMVDLLRYLRDRGVVVPDQGGWVLARALPDLQRELPESVRGMIQKKVDQLRRADRRLVLVASVQGPEFDSAVVARVLGRQTADVEERLHVLERVHALVRLVREQAFPDGILTQRYSFVHVLYQNALYASLQPTRRAAWCHAAAEALLGHYGEKSAAVAAELALLFEAAGQLPRAVEYFLLAARNAAGVFAHQEAAGLAQRGLALLEHLPDTPDRAGQELTLLLTLGVSLIATQGFASPDVEQSYLRARELCLRAQDTAALFPVLYGLWNVYLVRCEFPRCQDLATQMFALARDRSDPVWLLLAHNVMQQPLLHVGEFAAARRLQEQGLALYDPQQHGTLTAVYGEDPGVGCLAYGAVTLWCLGYPDQALRSMQEALRLADELANPFDRAQALYFGAFTSVCRREARRTRKLAGALTELCTEEGFTLLLHGGRILHGWSLAEQGRAGEGIGQMRQGLAGWYATGALSHRPYHLGLLAEALARDGQAQDGLTVLGEALALCTALGERFLEAELHRLRGELLLASEEAGPSAWGAADACFRQALDVARAQQAKSLELRAMMSLARLSRQQGRQAEARPLLAETAGWFTEGFDLPDLQEARALLECT
jgi:predicted ATPase/tRNA A-37 threonylcarbamoyl transferase component Bud32